MQTRSFWLAVLWLAVSGCTDPHYPKASEGGTDSGDRARMDGGPNTGSTGMDSGGTANSDQTSGGAAHSTGTDDLDAGDSGPDTRLDAGADFLQIEIDPVLATGVCSPLSLRVSEPVGKGELEATLTGAGFGSFFEAADCAAGGELKTLRVPLDGLAVVAYFKPVLAAKDYVARTKLTISAGEVDMFANVEIRRAAKEVMLGEGFGCSLLDDGSVWCWGAREVAGAAEQDFAVIAQPTRVAGIAGADVHSLAADWDHACVIVAGGVRCWGGFPRLGNSGAIPDGARTVTPVGMSAGAGVTSLDAAYSDTCAVKQGTVYCWGGDDSPNPTLVAGFDASDLVVEVGMGIDHRCARLQEGGIKCWGTNLVGQLGDNSTNSSPTPVSVSLDQGVVVSAVRARNYESCAVIDGSVKCWGGFHGPRTPSTQTGLDSDSKTTQLSMGNNHSCALLNDGESRCWGGDGTTVGQLGADDLQPLSSPGVKLAGLPSPVSSIVAGDSSSCALARGLVYCWGSNTRGQLASSTDLRRFLRPTAVSALAGEPVTHVTFSAVHSCVVANGKVSCWGSNFRAALGVGDDSASSSSLEPKDVVGIAEAEMDAGASGIRALSAAQNGWSTCAVTEAGAVKCWGSDVFAGQLEEATTVPFAVGTKASDVCVGQFHACALIESPNPNPGVYCWGQNSDGQLGDAAQTTASPTPVRAKVSGTATAISCSETRTCAAVDGGVRCWGTTDSYEKDPEPVDIANLVAGAGTHDPIVRIAMAAHQACALTDEGDVWCWVGQGAATQVSTGKAFERISGGGLETFCASAATGLWCWGSNDEGQLGNGMTNHSGVPLLVQGVSAPVQAFATGFTTCAMDAQGLKCWGSNLNRTIGGDAPYYLMKPMLTRACLE